MLKFWPSFIALALSAPAVAAASPIALAPQAPASQSPTPAPSGTQSYCGGLYQIPQPSRLPPAGSGPVVFQVGPCFEKQGGSLVVDAQTYLYYMQVTQHVSVPSANRWVPYDEKIEAIMLGDFKR